MPKSPRCLPKLWCHFEKRKNKKQKKKNKTKTKNPKRKNPLDRSRCNYSDDNRFENTGFPQVFC